MILSHILLTYCNTRNENKLLFKNGEKIIFSIVTKCKSKVRLFPFFLRIKQTPDDSSGKRWHRRYTNQVKASRLEEGKDLRFRNW